MELENETGDWKHTVQLSPPEANPAPTITGGAKKLTAMAPISSSTYTESRTGLAAEGRNISSFENSELRLSGGSHKLQTSKLELSKGLRQPPE